MSHVLRARVFSALILLFLSIYPLAACGQDVMHDTSTSHNSAAPPPSEQSVPVYTYEVVNSWSHDTKAFTQGLSFYQGSLYESTGHYGASTLRKVELRTGKVSKKVDVSSQYFAEGMTIFHDKIYQLTWTGQKGFIYDLKSFRFEGEFAYEGEGWGLTNDGEFLILSDGTNRIRFLDPVTYKTVRAINVLDNGVPLLDLNELEYVKGEIYANIWKSERIVRIDPHTGKILGWLDLTGLLPHDERGSPSEDVLNGIAYDEKDDRLFVTGKRWPKLFEIRLKKK
jgi:glutaminyl-peptide cyclotransferase